MAIIWEHRARATGRELLIENYALTHQAWFATKKPNDAKAIVFNLCLLVARTLTDEQLTSGMSILKAEIEGRIF